MNKIEAVEKIIETKSCYDIEHKNCPIGLNACEKILGEQNRLCLNDKAINWFRNWLKENEQRGCGTCRFYYRNNSDRIARCPIGTPPCLKENNYNKYQPIEEKRGCETCRFAGENNGIGFGDCPEGTPFCEEPNYCKYKPLQKEKTKMKKVVLELPNQEVYITMQWLEEKKACKEGKEWFAENLGKDFKLKFNAVFDFCEKNEHLGYANWIKNRIPNQVEGEFVHIDDVDERKHYAMKYDNKIFKLHRNNGKFYFSDTTKINNDFNGSDTLKKDITTHLGLRRTIYQFDSFDDFVDEYKKGNIK